MRRGQKKKYHLLVVGSRLGWLWAGCESRLCAGRGRACLISTVCARLRRGLRVVLNRDCAAVTPAVRCVRHDQRTRAHG